MTRQRLRSVCSYDCPDMCGLLVEVEDGRAISVCGDPEHPYTRGVLCSKMRHYLRTVYHPDRLTRPLRRVGEKGSGSFEPISWDEALAEIAQRWQTVIEDWGTEAILPYSYAGSMGLVQRNAGHPFFHRLGASRLERTICAPAKEAGWRAVMGNTPGTRPQEVRDSDLVILWGINAAATNLHFLLDVKAARRRGAKVWLLETYQTPTAPSADRVMLVRPGSDSALALGILHVLEREDLLDRAFIAEHVQGFEALSSQVLPHYSEDKVAALTGVPEEVIRELARAFGRARAPFIRVGSGLSRYANGAMTVRTISCLPALVGAYGRPGAGCLCGTATGGAFDMDLLLREDFLTKPTRVVNMNRLGQALTELSSPPIKSLYVYQSNPAIVAPDQNAVLAGLARDDLFTVVHERFLTDTARYADIVLPATTSLEHSDLYRSFGTYYVQVGRQVIPPVGESRSNWDTFAALAEALGFEDSFFRQSADDLVDQLLASSSLRRLLPDTAPLTAGYAVELPIANPGGPPFLTPSGKVEILNPAHSSPLPTFRPVYGGAYPLKLLVAPAVHLLNSSFCERLELRQREGGMQLKLAPAEAAARGLVDGQTVVAFNDLGTVHFMLKVTDKVPCRVAVAEGAWWMAYAPGERTVNALTSQRLTDFGNGSTFYDNTVEVCGAAASRDAAPRSQARRDP